MTELINLFWKKWNLKSTSDDSFTLELKPSAASAHSSLVSPIRTNGQFSHFTFGVGNPNTHPVSSKPFQPGLTHKLINQDWLLNNIHFSKGKFGYNPSLNAKSSLTMSVIGTGKPCSSSSCISNTDKQLAHRLNVNQHTGPNAKKSVKRLGHQNNRVFINNLNSKKHDCKLYLFAIRLI